MNWSAVAAIAAIIGVLVTIVGVAFTSGRLSEKIRVNAETVADHGKTLIEHRGFLDEHHLKIDRLEQWRNGYNAAASISGGTKVE